MMSGQRFGPVLYVLLVEQLGFTFSPSTLHRLLDPWLGWLCKSRWTGLQHFGSTQCPWSYFHQSGAKKLSSQSTLYFSG
jgi:hypothetical protein